MSIYNNNWKYSYTFQNPAEPFDLDQTDSPPLIGNGKIVIKPSFDGIQSTKNIYISTNVNDNQNKNTIETFNFGRVDFIDTSFDNISIEIDMYTGILNSKITNPNIDVEIDQYTPYNLPFCTVKTLRITPLVDVPELILSHEINAPETLFAPRYNNTVFHDSVTKAPIYAFSGVAKSTDNKTVAVSSAYVNTDVSSSVYDGFNIYENDTKKAFNRLKLLNLESTTADGQQKTYRIHILTVTMTSDDYENPEDEVKKILISIYNKGISNVRSTHVKNWAQNWLTDIQITPKDGIDQSQLDKIYELRGLCRLSLYHIYSVTRELISLPGSQTIGFTDIHGNIMSYGDLFTIPLLLLLKPDLGKSLLDYRFEKLKVAQQLAASYGFKGSKFPYATDNVGYKNNLYWNPHGGMTYYNTCLISINVWNYYRATQDKQWLMDFGYNILKHNAQFFASALSDANTIDNVYTISGIESSSNNTLTNNLILHAIKAAIEASYELSYIVPEEWKTLQNNLVLPTENNPNEYLYKYDADDPAKTEYAIAEPLFLYVPYYSSEFVEKRIYQNTTRIGTQKLNYDYHITKITAEHENNIINLVLKFVLNTLYAQYDPSTEEFDININAFINTSKGIFNNMTTDSALNGFDVTVGSAFLFALLQGFMQLNIRGGVAETRFYYDEFRLKTVLSAVMPSSWRNIKVVTKESNYITINV